MIKSKFLGDAGWKDVTAKNKVKDNGLLKLLVDLKKFGDDKHDEALKALDEVLKLAAQLKKDKAVTAVPVVAKYLSELVTAGESAVREIGKAKSDHDKVLKLKAEAEKKAAAKKDDDGDDDDDEAESPELLTTKLKPLLRLVTKGETMHALVARAGKQVSVLLSRKPIPPARRKMLTEQLGGGSTKFYPGHCMVEGGAPTFVLKAEVAGMAKLIKLALLQQTGLRMTKVKCRGEDGDDDDEDDGDTPGTQGDSQEDERERPTRDADVADLVKAPEMWQGTRDMLQYNVDALRRAIEEQAAGEGDDLVAEIKGNLAKLDRVFERLDARLSDSLAKARDAGSDEDRLAELNISKAIVDDYINYVRSEPLIRHLDRNPFGVATNLETTLAGSLTQLAKAIG